ncbi:MAG: glycosyltransferase, partial [Candidatus Hadarchaeum sp.]|uniref:glycosyltransferase n=1 Tax=Candidatus Hadarchaeum sp. TaxID=2883567 RepID=UPI00316AF715
MVRLLIVITGLAYGGAETQVVQLAKWFVTRGWEVQVITLLRPRAYVEELAQARIPVNWLGIRGKLLDPMPFIRLVRLIQSWRPHIVHSHMVHANILARLVRPLVRVPVLICTAHSIDERGRKGSGRFRVLLYRWTDPLCDLTTQVSQAGLERYVRIRAVPPHKIRYIPNGVDTERFCPNPELRKRLREEMGLGKAFVWLAVGRFGPQKDYPTMLRAFASVVAKYP